MAFSRSALLLCVFLGCAVGTWALGTPKAISTPVVMFDDDDISGDSQSFPVILPTGPAGGCAPCENLNFLRTNSWESYVAGNGTSIQLFDGHGCTGKTSGKIAPWGVIPGTLKDSTDSFILCYEPLIPLGAVGRPYPANV